MKSLNKAAPYVVALTLIGGVGSAWLYADPDLTDTSVKSTASTTSSTSISNNPLQPKASPAEMSVRLGQLDVQVKDDARHVLHLQAMARKQKDVIKLNCINDKMVQMKAQQNLFDAAHIELVPLIEARNGAEDTNRFAMFGQVSTGAENLHKLRTEADTCAGEPELVGESKNAFSGPALSDDPTKGDVFGNPVEPPGYASPYN